MLHSIHTFTTPNMPPASTDNEYRNASEERLLSLHQRCPSSDQQQQQQQPSFALPEHTPSEDGTGIFSASTGVRSSTVSSIGIEDLIEEQEAAQKAATSNNSHAKHKRGSDSLPVAPWRRESVVDLPDCSHMAVENITAVAAAVKAIPKPDFITTADARISMTTTCSSAALTTAASSAADTMPRKVTRKDSRSGRKQRMAGRGNSGNGKLPSMKNIVLRKQKQRMPPRVPSRDGTISTSSHGNNSSQHKGSTGAAGGGNGFNMFNSFRKHTKKSSKKKESTATTNLKKSKTKKVTSESTTKRRGRRPSKAAEPQPPQRTKSPTHLDGNHEEATSYLSTPGSTEMDTDADYILDHLSPAMEAKLQLGDSSDGEEEVEEGESSDSQEEESYLPNYTTNNTPTTSPKSNSHSRKERQKSLHLNQLMSFQKGESGSSSISNGTRKKERQKSFHLNQLMGLGSFRNLASLGSSSRPSKTSDNNIGCGHQDHDDHQHYHDHHNSHNHNSSSRYDGSFMSSISTAFSSLSASGFFFFHTSQRDRNRAEMDGESLPHLNMNSPDLNNDSALLADDDDEVEWEHDYGEPMTFMPPDLAQKGLGPATYSSSTGDQKGPDNKTPPRLPGRQKSWQSHNSQNNHGSTSQLQPSKSPVRRRRSDLMPKMPWRNSGGGVGHRQAQLFTSHGDIDCIAEAENEVDVSTSFHATNTDGEDAIDIFSVFPSGNILDVSHLPSPCVDKTSGGHRQRKRRESSPVLPTRKKKDDANQKDDNASQRQFYVATRAPDDRHPCRSNESSSDRYSRNNNNLGKSSSHDSQECPNQDMNFPIRRESLQTVATLQSTSEHLKAPKSVRPEATTMEKKSLLKQTLHFPKQRLGHVLKRVVSIGNSTAKSEEHPTTEQDNTASTIRSL